MLKKLYVIITVIVLSLVTLLVLLSVFLNMTPDREERDYLVIIPEMAKYHHYARIYTDLLKSYPEEDIIYIKKSRIEEIPYELKTRDLVRSRFFFSLLCRFYDVEERAQTGIFRLRGGKSSRGLLKDLLVADNMERAVYISSGSSLETIGHDMARGRLIGSPDEFMRVANSADNLDRLKSWYDLDSAVSVEGFIYPGIYFIDRRSPDLGALVKEAMERFEQNVGKFRDENRNIYSIIIRASAAERGLPPGRLTKPACNPSLYTVLKIM